LAFRDGIGGAGGAAAALNPARRSAQAASVARTIARGFAHSRVNQLGIQPHRQQVDRRIDWYLDQFVRRGHADQVVVEAAMLGMPP
jgi:hypothetical protein